MKKLIPFAFLLFVFQISAQNSAPYANTSLVHLKSISPALEASLHNLDATFLSCREHQSSSDIIVSETALNWLNTNNVVFETIITDLKQKTEMQ